MSRRRGLTLIELMVTMLLILVVSGALVSVFADSIAMSETVVRYNDAATEARRPIDQLADHLRNAQEYKTSNTSTDPGQYYAIYAGTATSVTYVATSGSFSVGSPDLVTYALSGTNLTRTADGLTTTVLPNVTSLEFRYYKLLGSNGQYNSDEANYLSDGDVVPCTNINAPTSGEFPLLIRIDILATVTVDGVAQQMVSSVRLRNSPFKKRI